MVVVGRYVVAWPPRVVLAPMPQGPEMCLRKESGRGYRLGSEHPLRGTRQHRQRHHSGWMPAIATHSRHRARSATRKRRDVVRALEVAKRIDSGICHINGPTVHDEAQMPFGGMKASGYGRFGGKAAVQDFTELRWITIQTTPRHYPF